MTNPSAPAEPAWLPALKRPGAYSHAAGKIELLETHISWVLLAGEFAYKLKKPVHFGFIDFSTLERRLRSCEEEVRLNRRTAPDLYLGVERLVKLGDSFRFGASGELVEPAVLMRQFPPGARLDRVAASGGLTDDLLTQLSGEVAKLHSAPQEKPSAIAASYPARLAKIFRENSALLPDSPRERELRDRFSARIESLGGLLGRRSATDSVRECHGDLHLANICLWKGKPTLFDCIEFNEDLRVIDVLSDAAFLCMDLVSAGLEEQASFFLTQYLEATGDYAGLEAWPLFVAYRAHVRAMVAHLSSQPERRDSYISLSEVSLNAPKGGLVMTVGLPGSGKSTEALRIARSEGGVRIRSDVERKRLHARHAGVDLYSSEMSRLTYETLLSSARAACLGGLVAVLDATFLRREHRAHVLSLAREIDVPVRIAHLTAPPHVLEARIAARQARGGDPSDADADVLRELSSRLEPFTPEEAPLVMEIKAGE